MATWTQADVDALAAVVGTGVLTVVYDGPPRRQVTYQSTEAMADQLAKMIAQVNNAAGTRTNYRFAATRKGFGTT